jgi:hypothetical protein
MTVNASADPSIHTISVQFFISFLLVEQPVATLQAG